MTNIGFILFLMGFGLSIYLGVEDYPWLSVLIAASVMVLGGIFMQFSKVFNGCYQHSHGFQMPLKAVVYILRILVGSYVLWGIVSLIPFAIAKLI